MAIVPSSNAGPAPSNPSDNFGRWLRNKREEKGLSQNALAERVKTDAAAIAEIEAGRTTCSRDFVIRLAVMMGASANEALIASGYAD